MRRRRAFTLLETIMATMLLAGCMLLLFNLYPASALAVRRSQDRMQADAVGQSLLADVRAQPFSSLTLGTKTEPDVTIGNTIYHRQVEVFAPNGDATLLKGIRVTVDWEWVRGKETVTHELYRVNLEK